jgi:hypothetical protein
MSKLAITIAGTPIEGFDDYTFINYDSALENFAIKPSIIIIEVGHGDKAFKIAQEFLFGRYNNDFFQLIFYNPRSITPNSEYGHYLSAFFQIKNWAELNTYKQYSFAHFQLLREFFISENGRIDYFLHELIHLQANDLNEFLAIVNIDKKKVAADFEILSINDKKKNLQDLLTNQKSKLQPIRKSKEEALLKLLIIDDNKKDCVELANMCENYFEVVQTISPKLGDEFGAYKKIIANADVIILDIFYKDGSNLLSFNGIDLANYIVENFTHKVIRFTTAYQKELFSKLANTINISKPKFYGKNTGIVDLSRKIIGDIGSFNRELFWQKYHQNLQSFFPTVGILSDNAFKAYYFNTYINSEKYIDAKKQAFEYLEYFKNNSLGSNVTWAQGALLGRDKFSSKNNDNWLNNIINFLPKIFALRLFVIYQIINNRNIFNPNSDIYIASLKEPGWLKISNLNTICSLSFLPNDTLDSSKLFIHEINFIDNQDKSFDSFILAMRDRFAILEKCATLNDIFDKLVELDPIDLNEAYAEFEEEEIIIPDSFELALSKML